MDNGIVLLLHGSKRPRAQECFFEIVSKLEQTFPGRAFKPAFLVQAAPNLPETIESLYRENLRKIDIYPIFLFEGLHLTEDVPEIIRNFETRYPDLELKLKKPLGEHRKFVEFLEGMLGDEL